MTPEELLNGTRKVVKDFHSYPKMLRRFARMSKLSFTTSTFTTLIGMNLHRYVWYKRDFGI